MAYFPFFVELNGVPGLIAGGGTVALRKAEKLLEYGPVLTVVAPEICPELKALSGVRTLERAFDLSDLEGVRFVIAATDNAEQNHVIADHCRKAGIPLNVVDDKDSCSFLFPALLQCGPLSVGISTGGASPSAAIWLKEQIAPLLPEHLDEILYWLDQQRPTLKQTIPDARKRADCFSKLFFACICKGYPLTIEEMQNVLSGEVFPE